MFFAHDIFEHKSTGRIKIDYFSFIYPGIFNHLAAARFTKDVSIASEKERRVLIAVAQGRSTPDKTRVSNATLYLKRLTEKNLIIKVNRGEYTTYHILFSEYLSNLEKKRLNNKTERNAYYVLGKKTGYKNTQKIYNLIEIL